jgi:hypothetical protein
MEGIVRLSHAASSETFRAGSTGNVQLTFDPCPVLCQVRHKQTGRSEMWLDAICSSLRRLATNRHSYRHSAPPLLTWIGQSIWCYNIECYRRYLREQYTVEIDEGSRKGPARCFIDSAGFLPHGGFTGKGREASPTTRSGGGFGPRRKPVGR